MIALLLAAQLSGQLPSNPHAQIFGAPPEAKSSEIIRALPPRALCAGDPGRLEASLAQPTAVYRKGDRPPHGLKNWVDYPNGQICLAEAAR
ncbi:hypothetical protein [Phenylobacterium sp.]|uniref:hypothetical protein n=1 Tax=Phenylobacterium sp. TaxID=1871053 RepID=UPI00122BB118|nr:hypothetical protein [Phenylobacterium sp.]THD70938.1 MAG: hypothetical protein E8A12_02385 [Phenylobacterium sp.]